MIRKIQELLQRRKSERTKREYLGLIEGNPRDTRSRLKLGDLYAKEGRVAEAVEQYASSAEVFTEAGFHPKSIALYKQIIKLQPQSREALRRIANISYQYGLYVDALPYYESLAKIYRDQPGGEMLSGVFQEVVRLPLKDNKRKAQVLEAVFPESGEMVCEPYERLLQVTRSVEGEEGGRGDAQILARWLSGMFPDRQEPRELLLSLLDKAGQRREAQEILGSLEGLYSAAGRLGEKTGFIEQQQAALHVVRGEAIGEPPKQKLAGPADQVKIKMEADIYDLLKKKSEKGARPVQGMEGATESGAESSGLERLEFQDLFSNFKEGIEKQIPKDDTETHYNLGVAYQEMELYEDAIEEFRKACGNPLLQHDAFFMMGNCARELQRLDEALDFYQRAVNTGGLGQDQVCAILYEKAVTLLMAERKAEALSTFREIEAKNSNYRDIIDKIENLL